MSDEIELKTAPADFRFPTTNQTRHCFTRYIEFHSDYHHGSYLKISGLVSDPPDAKTLAYFFHFTPGLNKTSLGDYLGDPDEFHLQVLEEFTSTFDFYGCLAAKGEESNECERFAKYYRALCPGEWVERWNEQRENGTFAGPL